MDPEIIAMVQAAMAAVRRFEVEPQISDVANDHELCASEDEECALPAP